MPKRERPRKGVFTAARLPVARRYLVPGPRGRMLLAALGLAGAAIAALGIALWLQGRIALAQGPLSASHAGLGSSCGACHEAGRGPADDVCRACHERAGESPGPFSFAAHYAYRSGDPTRPGRPTREAPCAACHPEHRGRDAALTAVPDATCTGCHGFASFNRGHPEFAFARAGQPDPAHLSFRHAPHVREIERREDLDQAQLACRACHQPEASGRGFAPIDFDRHCAACHLTGGAGTPELPVADPARPRAPGVETVEAIRRQGGLGSRWALFAHPGEIRASGSSVAKRPVRHEDPWVLWNLRRIRRILYPGLELADLLVTAADGSEGPALTLEAIANLRAQARELSDRPEREVQRQVRDLLDLLQRAEERVRAGQAPPAVIYTLPAQPDPRLSAEEVVAWRLLALALTEPCRTCHAVADAGIRRVQKDQRTLRRAEFDHRAHLVARPFCLDCHGAIPGLWDPAAPEHDPRDVAETQNLPAIAACRPCHTPRQAGDRCTTCHLFHPGASPPAGALAALAALGAPAPGGP